MATFTPNIPVETKEPTIQVEGLRAGPHRFQLIVEDEFGNRSQPSVASVVVSSRNPAITSISPGFGNWGQEVIIGGTNFEPVPEKNHVLFNNIEARVIAGGATQLTVLVPEPATTGPVTVTTGAGRAVSPFPFSIPRLFDVKVGAQPSDLAFDSRTANLWVVNTGPFDSTNRGTVAVVSLKARKVLANIIVGTAPKEMALAAAGERRVCVVLNSGGSVSVIDLDSMLVVASIRVSPTASALDISPDGRWTYVLVPSTAIDPSASITVIDMSVFKIVATIPVGRAPTRVVFSPDGQFAAVNNTRESSISLINVRAHKVEAVIGINILGSEPGNPQEVAFSRNTFPFWTANLGDAVSTGGGATSIDKAAFPNNWVVRFPAMTVAVTRDGMRAFLMGPQQRVMITVDLSVDPPLEQKVKTIGVASSVKAIATTQDDRAVIAVHADESAMSVFEAATLRLCAVVRLPAPPLRCLTMHESQFAAALCPKNSSVSILELESVLPTLQ